MRAKEKKRKLLLALYERKFDGESYDVSIILKGFTSTNNSEAYNIAKSLEDEGLIKLSGPKDNISAEIIYEGVENVESGHSDQEVSPEYYPDDLFESYERDELKSQIDELTMRFKSFELGQQITYDDIVKELEELKRLLTVLGKKDWRQNFKGKMVEFGFGQLSEKTIDLLVETFKNNKLLD